MVSRETGEKIRAPSDKPQASPAQPHAQAQDQAGSFIERHRKEANRMFSDIDAGADIIYWC